MTIEELAAGTITIFGARNSSGDENYGAYAGKLTDEDIFALTPEIWPADEEGIDYDLYMNDAIELQPGNYTVSFTSSESGDHFYDIIEGHVTDNRVLRAYAMVDMEDWWSYDRKVKDPNLGVDDYSDSPNLDETIFLKVI